MYTNCTESESEERLFLYAYDEVFEPGSFFLFILFCFVFPSSLLSLARYPSLRFAFPQKKVERTNSKYSFYSETLWILINPAQSTWVPWNNDNQSARQRSTQPSVQNSCTHRVRESTSFISYAINTETIFTKQNFEKSFSVVLVLVFVIIPFQSFIYLFYSGCRCWRFSNTVHNLFADHTIVHRVFILKSVQTNTFIYRGLALTYSHAFKGSDLSFIFVISFYQKRIMYQQK